MRYLLFLFLILCNLQSKEDPFRFSEKTFTKAKQDKKLIFLFIGSDVGLESRSFLKELVTDKDYSELIKEDFVFALLDYDLNPSLSIRYSIPTIPGFMILDHDGKIYLGATRPKKDVVYPIVKQILDTFKRNPKELKEELKLFQKSVDKQDHFDNIADIIDSTMNLPNHISLDLGRYILALNPKHPDFEAYTEQLLDWIKSENFDHVEGCYFMPRGFSTYFAESKYSFFNFKILELLFDFYIKTGHPRFKYALIKSLKILHRDLMLTQKSTYSTGYASKKYFKMSLKERLKYFPPAPRNFDLAITQILFLKILYKLEILLKRKLVFPVEISFMDKWSSERLSSFDKMITRYKRDDGLLYFTPQKKFTNFETQLEFFSLLYLMRNHENTNKEVFLKKMEELFNSFLKAFYDPEKQLFCDTPLAVISENKSAYQYPLYFVREHARLFVFLDFLHNSTGKNSYLELKQELMSSINKHNQKFPHRFYWLDWYDLLSKRKKKQ
jgi:hypothetical protein